MKAIAKIFGMSFCIALFAGGTIKFLYWFAGHAPDPDTVLFTSIVFWASGLIFVGIWLAVGPELWFTADNSAAELKAAYKLERK